MPIRREQSNNPSAEIRGRESGAFIIAPETIVQKEAKWREEGYNQEEIKE
ncbi:hypothetical protein HZB94_05115, partial [Candidatus Falkowbacteria bacterium]|nr:hypothetical protein [Candidatus Falkowbacteria bacterium]